MTWSIWLMFLMLSLTAAFSPGPGVLFAIATASHAGPKQVIYSSGGNALGVLIVAGLATTGLGTLFHTSATAFSMFKLLGAGYLMWLGFRAWKSGTTVLLNKTPTNLLSTATTIVPQSVPSGSQLFRQGLLVAVTNPKAIMFFAAVFPQFMQLNQFDWSLFLLLSFTFVACTLLSHLCYVFGIVYFGQRLQSNLWVRHSHQVVALVFVTMACALLRLSVT